MHRALAPASVSARPRSCRQCRPRTLPAPMNNSITAATASLAASPIKVVGMGSAGVDYLAQVAAYPHPDEKIRTERLEVQGGGNCGNALTAAARLGLAPCLVTKIGGDALGDGIVAEFEAEGVSTAGVLRAAGAPSPFTYIIVDREGGTRTCIHTPGEAFTPAELTPELAETVLAGARLVYFDGRLTEAALLLAAAARRHAVPVLVEAERLRPGLEELLQLADYVVTSAHFPQGWTGEVLLGDALAVTLARLPRAQWVITTLGKRGSVLMERSSGGGLGGDEEVLEDLVERLFKQAAAAEEAEASSSAVVCRSANGVEIRVGGVNTAPASARLLLKRSEAEGAAAAEAAASAARAEAKANADAGNATGYEAVSTFSDASSLFQPPHALVTVAQAARLPAESVLDTTGAGDAFIGSVLYCLATGQPPLHALRLGSVVAACKCTALGARPGLPARSDLAQNLL